MGLKLITPPAAEPVTLADVKQHLRVTDTADDLYIGALIAAARQHLDGWEGWLGRSIMPQTWELVLDAFPCNEIKIPATPVQSITSIKFDAADGFEQTLATSAYFLDNSSLSPWVLPSDAWPATLSAVNAVRVRFVAGYADAASVPAPIKAAIMLIVGKLYRLSGDTVGIRREVVDGIGATEWTDSDKVIAAIDRTVEALLNPLRILPL
jgi:uncharacterized phiE125 gp8 family phage protein